MGCVNVGISNVDGKVSVGVLSYCGTNVSATKYPADDVAVKMNEGFIPTASVVVSCGNSNLTATATSIGGNVGITASIVCGTGLSDEYYLLVEEGYTLTIKDEYITVLKNG